MKQLAMIVTAWTCVFLLSVPAAAASFLDTMGEAVKSEFRTVDGNLAQVHYTAAEASDQYQMMITPGANGILQGGIHYYFTGATKLSFRLYSPKGTFAAPDSEGAIQFGTAGDAWESPAKAIEAQFHPATGGVYVNYGGWKTLAGRSGSPELVDAQGFDGAGLISYGVNLYVGTGASARTKLTPTRVAVEQRAVDMLLFCVEDFTCTIPAGTTHLWIELNDAGGTILSLKGSRTSLAWVSLEGDFVSMGLPSASPSQPASQLPESSAPSQSSSRSTSRSAASGSVAAGGGTGSSVVAETSSKFEGVITSSQSSTRARTSPSTEEEIVVAEESVQIDPAPVPAAELPQAAQVYEIRRAAEPDPFDFGVILYILVVVGVIGFLLIRPKRL